jgi:hypothetical protein
MLALDRGVVDAVWRSFSAYLAERPVSDHPLCAAGTWPDDWGKEVRPTWAPA